ncbi:hypothetical protein COEREDRAFT_89409 [Coemansia reversa NRRL 1564]|uniref:Uncharacterized protein n=1 Tax=Coemansia reversa (strain ATCC 12441 / NRRL 1564) TaxID=763665 RepID=A0A2G5B4K5_COERN|nr:hypothetical protein COEREDRAFT_89409 [Coemansia reversa NRRL 1564]|eukprot:PIA13657.1 hypothetical protein COEREDRAFT_89409 [Coemansia reversa NRRL 1564]
MEPIREWEPNPVEYFGLECIARVYLPDKDPEEYTISPNDCTYLGAKKVIESKYSTTKCLYPRGIDSKSVIPIYEDGKQKLLFPFRKEDGIPVLRYSKDGGETAKPLKDENTRFPPNAKGLRRVLPFTLEGNDLCDLQSMENDQLLRKLVWCIGSDQLRSPISVEYPQLQV